MAAVLSNCELDVRDMAVLRVLREEGDWLLDGDLSTRLVGHSAFSAPAKARIQQVRAALRRVNGVHPKVVESRITVSGAYEWRAAGGGVTDTAAEGDEPASAAAVSDHAHGSGDAPMHLDVGLGLACAVSDALAAELRAEESPYPPHVIEPVGLDEASVARRELGLGPAAAAMALPALPLGVVAVLCYKLDGSDGPHFEYLEDAVAHRDRLERDAKIAGFVATLPGESYHWNVDKIVHQWEEYRASKWATA